MLSTRQCMSLIKLNYNFDKENAPQDFFTCKVTSQPGVHVVIYACLKLAIYLGFILLTIV